MTTTTGALRRLLWEGGHAEPTAHEECLAARGHENCTERYYANTKTNPTLGTSRIAGWDLEVGAHSVLP